MNLSDYFPDSFNATPTYILEVGSVLRMMVKETDPPKIKRFIIVGESGDHITLAATYINTELNLNVNWNLDLRSQHIKFEAEGRGYLEHDSYIDCSKLIFWTLGELQEIVKNRPSVLIGKVNDDDFDLIRNQIIHSPTIKGKIKNKYGFYEA